MIHSNLPEKERPVSLSFSLSNNETTTDKKSFLASVLKKVEKVLRHRFSHPEKQKIDSKPGRWNFACPYCGDSHTDNYKKRGNIYSGESVYYKCYNCGKYASIDSFLKSFNVELSLDEITLAKSLEKRNTDKSESLNISFLWNQDALSEIAIPREKIEEKFELLRIDKSDISSYLIKRRQPNLERFSWDPVRQQLYIFNLIPETNLVLGYQIRNFKYKPKYLTYDLVKLYEMWNLEVTPDIVEANEISTMFGILDIDMNKPVTVFEGPLDAFLMRNSVGTCSANIDVPFKFGNLRYMYDYDTAGIKSAIEKANAGYSVFLWKKLLKDLGIYTNKKMDLTELVVLAKRKGFKLPKLADYFSKNKFDVYEL